MDIIKCECCNKKIRNIKNKDLRDLIFEFKNNKEKLCKSCYYLKTNRCDNCLKKWILFNKPSF